MQRSLMVPSDHMNKQKLSCKATIDGELLESEAACYVDPMHGYLSIRFARSVALVGSRRQQFSQPSFSLYPFTPSLLTRWDDQVLAEGTTLEMSGTDIGYWRVEHDPKERRADSYRLKSVIVRTTFFRDGIGLKIEARTDVGVSEYEGQTLERDLPGVAISISIFVPTSELGRFLMPQESPLFSMEERLSKLPPSPT